MIPAIISPFVPFGVFELRLPVAWDLNYFVERFNGYSESELEFGGSGKAKKSGDGKDNKEKKGGGKRSSKSETKSQRLAFA